MGDGGIIVGGVGGASLGTESELELGVGDLGGSGVGALGCTSVCDHGAGSIARSLPFEEGLGVGLGHTEGAASFPSCPPGRGHWQLPSL
jgi:hypothetical protein